MNSVTPVTSLSETIKNMLTDENGHALPPEKLTSEKIDDIILALSTIIRRSQGMLGFVDEYRKLTKLPAPHMEVFSVEELLRESCQLMQMQARESNINIEVSPVNSRLALKADRKMVEQVIINLIGNSIHALEGQAEGKIILSADLTENEMLINVRDNGPGIPRRNTALYFHPVFLYPKKWNGHWTHPFQKYYATPQRKSFGELPRGRRNQLSVEFWGLKKLLFHQFINSYLAISHNDLQKVVSVFQQ